MASTATIVLFAVVAVAIVVGVVGLLLNRSGGSAYDQIGRGGLSIEPVERGAQASPSSPREREEELRQMLTARSERRERQGGEPIDVDAELARLLTPGAAAADAGLATEVRQLVLARNERRARQGKPPLDVDAEVERQLRELST